MKARRPFNSFGPWCDNAFVVVDTETTGVDTATARVVELALVRFERGEPVEDFDTLVDPGIPIPAEATAVHGIADADVQGAPTLEQAVQMLGTVHHEAFPVAYNHGYDRALLLPVLDLGPVWTDPLVVVRRLDKFVKGKGRHTLKATCKRWGVPIDNAHTAAADAVATGCLLWQLRFQLGEKSSVGDLLKWQVKEAAAQQREYEQWRAQHAEP